MANRQGIIEVMKNNRRTNHTAAVEQRRKSRTKKRGLLSMTDGATVYKKENVRRPKSEEARKATRYMW